MQLTINDLYDLEHTLAKDYLSQFTYPWEALKGIKDMIMAVGEKLPKDEYIKKAENVWVANDATIYPTATIIGPTIIGHNTEVRPGAFIRGSVLVGEDCVVGNSTELKNCILFDHVEVPHYNYVGDSIYGYHSHTGAGTIASNLKTGGSNVVVHNEGVDMETGCRKFGAMVGDYADVGCNAVMNPGTVVGRHSRIYPTSLVRGVIPEYSIYKAPGNIAKQEDR